jgi:(p)ppGpp synthase/HD superfamily hydrolase
MQNTAFTPSPRLAMAMAFAENKHRGQFRRGGAPYITHPMAVCELLREWGYDEDTQIAGLFHDLLEDTDATEEDILRLGGRNVLEAVKLLTKAEGYVMAEYISAIRENPMAFSVKGADRLHNLRCAVVADEAFRARYIEETLAWYMDFHAEIPVAVQKLREMQE